MYKLLGFVTVLTCMSFAEMITIDLTVPEEGWDHKNASLLSINLDNYLGTNKVVESAVLQFTDIQNLREPENNDILNISLLKLNGASGPDQYISTFQDGIDNDNTLNAGNFFEIADPYFSSFDFIAGKSEIASYTDNNDNFNQPGGSYIETLWQPMGTQDVNPAVHGTGWYFMTFPNNANWWARVRNYTTEDFDRTLDASVVNEFKDASNGWIGIGIDADCHYMGNVSLVVNTTSVPEPATLSLLGFGLLGMLFFRRKK